MKKIFCAFLVLLFASAVFAQSYSIERYLNIRSAGSPTFSTDGKRIAFLTNITGTSQIWMMDAAGGYPEQITSFQDNVGFVRWSPAGNGILFGKASGGDENTQFFWMSSDGAEIKQLTNNPKVRHNFGDWSERRNTNLFLFKQAQPQFFRHLFDGSRKRKRRTSLSTGWLKWFRRCFAGRKTNYRLALVRTIQSRQRPLFNRRWQPKKSRI